MTGQILACMIGFLGGHAVAGVVNEGVGANRSHGPRYELKLRLEEFSVLNSAALLGVRKYGGTADFAVGLAKDGNDVSWTVKIEDPRLMEVWEYWMAEKTAELVNMLDFDKLNSAAKSALATVKSVNAKVALARANPIWDPVKLSGAVTEKDGRWVIQSEEGEYLVTGDNQEQIKTMKGKPIVATGFVKVANQIELTSFMEKKPNTLELFVMSQCPFAKNAEASIIEFLRDFPGDTRPSLEIRYIFYQRVQDGKTVISSLHGEPEIQEDLVQMIIRDMWPRCYFDYLLRRAQSNAPWDELARQAGLSTEEIESVKTAGKEGREALIQAEYDYTTKTYGIHDGSPTYIWENERIGDLRSVQAFHDLRYRSGTCSEE